MAFFYIKSSIPTFGRPIRIQPQLSKTQQLLPSSNILYDYCIQATPPTTPSNVLYQMNKMSDKINFVHKRNILYCFANMNAGPYAIDVARILYRPTCTVYCTMFTVHVQQICQLSTTLCGEYMHRMRIATPHFDLCLVKLQCVQQLTVVCAQSFINPTYERRSGILSCSFIKSGCKYLSEMEFIQLTDIRL